MTRSEAIEAAAMRISLHWDSPRTTDIQALRRAIASPPDPDWQAIARQLAAALTKLRSEVLYLRDDGTVPADVVENHPTMRAVDAALSLMPPEAKP